MSDPILIYLETHLDDYLADLRHLTGIDCGTENKEGVDQVQAWLETRLADAGFTVTRNPQERWGDDLIARRRGDGRAKVMLLGHADTVYPDGTAAARPMTIQGDKVLGPGTCDMKAGVLAGLYAVRALDHAGWNGLGELTFVIVSDEEIEERHSSELLKTEGPLHDAVLTLEAARENGDIVTARKATRGLTVEAFGKSAHAGVEPEKGSSANLALAHVIVETFKLNGRRDGMTVNPGPISSTAPPNVVAPYAKGVFDLRAWSTRELGELSEAFREIAERAWVKGVEIKAYNEFGGGMPAMERTAGTVRLEEHAIGIANELGFPLKGARTGGGSDVSFACHLGTPGLDGLGPIGGLDHGPDEYILRSSIVPRVALLAKLLTAIGKDEEFTHD